VRDVRTPDLPPRLSSGSAAELSGLMVALARGVCVSPAVSRRVGDWMLTSTDLSMVAAAAGLDPLAHTRPDRGVLLRSKTGIDDGVRADVGVLDGPAGRRCYAVAANWPPEHGMRGAVLAAMRVVGRGLLGSVDPDH
jgi:beta-lactamase class A